MNRPAFRARRAIPVAAAAGTFFVQIGVLTLVPASARTGASVLMAVAWIAVLVLAIRHVDCYHARGRARRGPRG